MRCKHYWFSVTEEYVKENNIKIFDVVDRYKSIKKWAVILHDKDTYTYKEELENPEHKEGTKKPNHYHIYCHFGDQSLDHKYFAEMFGDNEHSVKRIETTAANCLLYFVHGTADAIAEGKYPYEWSEVRHSSNWFPEVVTEQERFIGNFDSFSYKEQIEKIHQIKDVRERIKMQEVLDKALATELKYRATFIDRFIQVMFISGESGTGKTTFARQFVEKLNYFDIVPEQFWRKKSTSNEKRFRHLDYGVSGSSNDVFENYKGEDVYILDDMRDDSLSFTDLLKFLDNHTNSPVKSRFVNKCFVGVMLIITSKQPLSQWYRKEGLTDSTLLQLYRRISNYVIVQKDNIKLYTSIDKEGRPTGECRIIPNNTYEYYKDKPKPVNVNNLICDLFGEIKPDVIVQDKMVLTEIVGDEDKLPF